MRILKVESISLDLICNVINRKKKINKIKFSKKGCHLRASSRLRITKNSSTNRQI